MLHVPEITLLGDGQAASRLAIRSDPEGGAFTESDVGRDATGQAPPCHDEAKVRIVYMVKPQIYM